MHRATSSALGRAHAPIAPSSLLFVLPRPPSELLLDAHSPSCCSSSPPAAALRHSSFPFFLRLFVPRAETSSIGHVGARARLHFFPFAVNFLCARPRFCRPLHYH